MKELEGRIAEREERIAQAEERAKNLEGQLADVKRQLDEAWAKANENDNRARDNENRANDTADRLRQAEEMQKLAEDARLVAAAAAAESAERLRQAEQAAAVLMEERKNAEAKAHKAMEAALRERTLRDDLAKAELEANKVAADAWSQLGGVTKLLEQTVVQATGDQAELERVKDQLAQERDNAARAADEASGAQGCVPPAAEAEAEVAAWRPADATVAREDDFGAPLLVRTHLGGRIEAGDECVGYDLEAMAHLELDDALGGDAPPIVLVAKKTEHAPKASAVARRRRRRRHRDEGKAAPRGSRARIMPHGRRAGVARGEGTLSASRSRERGSEGNDETVWGFKWRRVSSMENPR